MSPLEAARKIEAAGFPYSSHPGHTIACDICNRSQSGVELEDEYEHAPHCPWLSMPTIIRALEAAEMMLGALEAAETFVTIMEAAEEYMEATEKP